MKIFHHRNAAIFIVGLCSTLFVADGYAQADHKILCIGFYNVENLFDTLDSPDTDDIEFTPNGVNHYTPEIYKDKLNHLAEVISQLGTEVTPDGVAILGVSEIENRSVLEDLAAHPKLSARRYKIVHYDSPDARGVDVALFYQEKYFAYDSSKAYPLITEMTADDTSYSRDILAVYGKIDGEKLCVTVNHWPSRRSGEAATAHLRNAAATINKTIVDRNSQAGIKTIVLGDLNDDPVNESIKTILKARPTTEKVANDAMFNPMYDFYKKGLGTTAYRDAWSLFDQIILSSNLIPDGESYHYYKAHVFNAPFIIEKLGRYKGYPKRTYSGNTYIGGYSDHFPVYVFLVKPLNGKR